MAFKNAKDGTETLDFNNVGDNFGRGSDFLIIADSYGAIREVKTYEGNDTIVLNNFSQGYASRINAGLGDDRIYGGAGVEVVSGGGGNDFIYAAGGDDQIYNDRGDDIMDGGTGFDILHLTAIDDNGRRGSRANREGITCDLRITDTQDLGSYGLDRIANIEGVFGGAGDDVFNGDDGVNMLEGREGNDRLFGNGGDDILFCFSGRDIVTGGLGADQISIDDGFSRPMRDIVIYETLLDSGTTVDTRDNILSFEAGGTATSDQINLRAIDADRRTPGNQAFTIVSAFTGVAGEMTLIDDGTGTVISLDVNGDTRADSTIYVALAFGSPALSAVDFVL